MNNKILWAVFAIVVLGGVWYLSSRPQGWSDVAVPVASTTAPVSTSTVQTPTAAKPAPVRTTTKPTPPVPAKVTGVGPLSYLFGLKQSLVCSISTRTGTKRSGTMYVAGGQMRVNFSNSSMIGDGTYLYVWTTGATKGLKLLAASSAAGSAIAMNGGFDPAYDISYGCNPWSVNASVFALPAQVSFSNSL